jgi:hypothetical protein
MTKPEITLHGWQTAKDYAKSKGWTTDKYVYELIKQPNSPLASLRVPELNNILLVKEKELS